MFETAVEVQPFGAVTVTTYAPGEEAKNIAFETPPGHANPTPATELEAVSEMLEAEQVSCAELGLIAASGGFEFEEMDICSISEQPFELETVTA